MIDDIKKSQMGFTEKVMLPVCSNCKFRRVVQLPGGTRKQLQHKHVCSKGGFDVQRRSGCFQFQVSDEAVRQANM